MPATSDAVLRTTWIASALLSGRPICPFLAASLPYASTSAITPPTVGVDSEVVPPPVAAENTLCVPQEVKAERAR